MRYKVEQRDAYENVNRMFAQKLAPLITPDDVIWVHDYHLIPLGRRLRELGVRRPLGFFLHIPFPNIEMLRVLPGYAELLRAAGVPVELDNAETLVHGFISFNGLIPAASEATDRGLAALRAALHG